MLRLCRRLSVFFVVPVQDQLSRGLCLNELIKMGAARVFITEDVPLKFVCDCCRYRPSHNFCLIRKFTCIGYVSHCRDDDRIQIVLLNPFSVPALIVTRNA